MTTAAIIVAAGKGTRAGGEEPKQWRTLAGRCVVEHSIALFENHPCISSIILVVSKDDLDRVKTLELDNRATIAIGGETRALSVMSGLKHVDTDYVLIHDAARCCMPPILIDRVISALANSKAAAPALPVSDTLWMGIDGRVTRIQPRDGLFRAQTPQGFERVAFEQALRLHHAEATDDVSVARAAGLDVSIVEGDPNNFKITKPEDFDRAEKLLRGSMDIRTGNGFDVHRFCDGNHVVLCGVKIPFNRGLSGHSDADVGMHAVTDAIYGALANGDIGQHFPPSDPQWKGAASTIFLEHACHLAADAGYKISNADCTLICEQPKIGPHAQSMKNEMSRIMKIEPDRVSVKATTSERLGFTGRGEGIAAMATVTLVRT